MTFAAHVHPLLVHFPIGLVLIAALFEAAALVTGLERWHAVAVANVRAGAAFAVATAVTGWLLADALTIDGMPALEWHRWFGTTATIVAIGAAMATRRPRGSAATRSMYLAALFGAAALTVVTGHLGGVLVWGADFLRP
jgi:uncharacterized membrane protein